MSDLKISTVILEAVGSDLDLIKTEFEGADEMSDTVGDATGDNDLAQAVRDFAHSWNDKRAAMLESVTALHSSITTISEAFTDTDNQLTQALEDAATGATAPPAPAGHGAQVI